MVIGGDFNLVLDVEKGKKNGIARTHQNALEVVQDAMENMELCDVREFLIQIVKDTSGARDSQKFIADFFLSESIHTRCKYSCRYHTRIQN